MTLFQTPEPGVRALEMDLTVLRYAAQDAGFTTHEVDLARVPTESALLDALRGALRLPSDPDWDGLRDALATPGPGRVFILTGWPSLRSDHPDLAARVEQVVRAAQDSGGTPLYAFGLH